MAFCDENARPRAVWACGIWPRGEIPADFLEAVHCDAPVLIFSGNMDPVTPPKFGEQVARHLPNSRHVVIPEAAHGVDGGDLERGVDQHRIPGLCVVDSSEYERHIAISRDALNLLDDKGAI